MEDEQKINIIFKYHEYRLDSFSSFDDGDFIIGYTIYDGKTLKPKLYLGYYSIFILGSHQIGILSDLKFELYNLNNDRTKKKFYQTIIPKGNAIGLRLKKLSNDDLLVYSFYLGTYDVAVYRKIYNIYEIQNQFLTENLDEIIELNKDEVLGYKLYSSELLVFKVLSKDNYELKRKNEISLVLKGGRRRIYLTQPISKLSDDKLISFGASNIYIFDIKTLELETTIKIFKSILNVLIRPKGDIIFFSKTDTNKKETYYLDDIKLDLKSNEIMLYKEKDITYNLGDYKTLFCFFNYKDDGFATITDNTDLLIYDKYYD